MLLNAVSAWVSRWQHLITPNSCVLDMACGSGRHSLYLSDLGHQVTAVDMNLDALQNILDMDSRISTRQVDLENAPWPFEPASFDAIVVTNYLWRPRFSELLATLCAGGLLVYETFAAGNETVGKPSRPAFLLQRGELLKLCAGLQVIAFEDGFATNPERFVQRIVASKIVTPQKRFHL